MALKLMASGEIGVDVTAGVWTGVGTGVEVSALGNVLSGIGVGVLGGGAVTMKWRV